MGDSEVSQDFQTRLKDFHNGLGQSGVTKSGHHGVRCENNKAIEKNQ
jgi:hypothetical protein